MKPLIAFLPFVLAVLIFPWLLDSSCVSASKEARWRWARRQL